MQHSFQQQRFPLSDEYSMWLLLAALEHGPSDVALLLDALEQQTGIIYEPGTLYRWIATLERRGWIERAESDEGQSHYHITAPGVTALSRQNNQENSDEKVDEQKTRRFSRSGVKENSMRIVIWIVQRYPRAWRERYESEMRALLEQHTITPFTIFDLLFACLDAHLDPHFRTQRMSIPTPAYRLAALAFISLFPLFLLANYLWGVIVSDPGGILYPIFTTTTNPLAHFSESIIIGGTLLTLLAALIGGLLVAGQAIRYGLTARRWGFLFAASLPLLIMLFSLVAASTPLVNHSSITFLAIIIMVFTALLCGLAFALLVFQQGKMGQRIMRILLVPATITALVMPVMALANIVWAISLWSDIFQNFPLPSSTFFSWLMGWGIDFSVMALPTLIVLIMLIRAIRPLKPAALQQEAQAQSARM